MDFNGAPNERATPEKSRKWALAHAVGDKAEPNPFRSSGRKRHRK
jgi:hypothetical protein